MNQASRTVVRVALLCAALFLGMVSAAQADREFDLRFSANEPGSIKGIANANMTCAAGVNQCANAQNAAVTDSVFNVNDNRNNNAHQMVYVDVDNDPSTFNSSSANQSLPAGSEIMFAALYWGGHYSGARAPADPNLRNRVKLKVPGSSSYQTITASTVDDGEGSGNSGRYQAFADVTGQVQGLPASGNGTYTVADIQSATGSDRYSGWSLIVAYRNAAETMKNMTIFDGLVSISGSITRNINISGFLTPPAGPINAEVGFVTWEGDLALNGDRAEFNGQYLSDPQHPSENFFNSRISHNGTLFTDRNPAHPNSLGMEAAWTTPPAGTVTHNMTSATVKVSSTGDQYLPGVITFQTEIFSPKIEQIKTAVDDNGGSLEQGDVITYTIAGENTGDDGTANFVLRDPIPANTTYVPGSIRITKSAGASTGPQTDAVGDDRGEFDAGNNRIVARLGQGSNATVGGNIAPGEEYEVTFQVRVNGPDSNPVPNLTSIENEATADFYSKIGGMPLTAKSKAEVTVKSPDLRIVKERSGDDFVAGGSSEYTLAIDNHGDAPTQGQVTVSDPIPAGLTVTGIDAPGWSCNPVPADSLSCSRSDALAPGDSYPDIVLTVDIAGDVDGEVENTSTVSGGGDANLGDNTSSSTNPASQKADLEVTKTASQGSVKIGDEFTYDLTVTNNGPSKATSVALSDEIPAGLDFVSADPGCTFEPVNGTVVCDLGEIANGDSVTVTVTVSVNGNAGGLITNVATVGAQQEDPVPSNNTDTETVDASGADLKVIKKLSSPKPEIRTGDTVVYKVTVENNGPSDATGVTLYDALPAGLTDVTTDKPESVCAVSDGAITCAVGDLANGSSFTVTVTGKVKPGQSELTNTASATGNEDDPNPGDNSDTITNPVTPVADLAIVKEADTTEVTVGESFLYAFKVTNNGPDDVTGITITDTLPAGLTYVQGAPGCNVVGQVVTCSIDFLAAGGSGQAGITVKVNADAGDEVVNTATVGSDLHDPDPGNNSSTAKTPVKRKADVAIVKTADLLKARPGDVITYTLKAKNNGPGAADNVVVTDALPVGVSFVSADAPCAEDSGTVTCELGTLAPGQEASLQVKVRVEPWGDADPHANHALDVQKVEAQIDLEAGATKTVQATCPSGYFVSDGSVRIDHIDQGTGDWPAPQVVESRASSLDTWQGTVRNTASGRAQAKIFAVCIKKTTAGDGGHSHDLVVSAPVTATESLVPGRNEAVLECGPGQVATQPGFIASVPGDLVYSQPAGNGWKFAYEVEESGSATFSIRCLTRQVSLVNGHTHDLVLKRIWTEQTIAPGEVAEVQLICPDGSKGIVGGWDLDHGLVSLGNDPRPVTRAFKVYNPTDEPLTARFSLLCLGDRSGGEHLAPKLITNTAQISTSTEESDTGNNSSSVTFDAEDTDNHDPIDDGDGKTPVKNGTGGDRGNGKCVIANRSVRYRHGKVTARIRCNRPARGLVRLRTTKRIKVGARKYARGTVLAGGSFVTRQAGVKTITFRATRTGKRILRKRSVRKGRLAITGGSTKPVRILR